MAFFLLVLYVGAMLIRPQEWLPLIYGFPILDLLMVGIAVTTLTSLRGEERLSEKAPQIMLSVGLLAAVVMSHVAHTYFSMMYTAFTEFGKNILVFLLLIINIDSEKRVKIIVGTVIVGCLFLATQGLLQHYRGYGFGSPGGEAAEISPGEAGPAADIPLRYPIRNEKGETIGWGERVRAFGVFHDPNDLALMLVFAMPFLYWLALRKGVPVLGRVAGLACFPLLIMALYYTESRGGWLAMGATVLALAALATRRKLAVALLPFVVVGLVFFAPARVSTMADSDAGHSRIILWGEGNTMFKSNPIFGIGWQMFTDNSTDSQVAHNSFIQCYAELGLFGYFFWLALVGAVFVDMLAIRRATLDRPELLFYHNMSTAYMAGFFGFMTASLFLTRTYVPHFYVLLALPVALRIVYEHQHGALAGAFHARHLKFVFGAALLSIPTFWVLIRMTG